ncbi:non-specific lipid transfer protein GPI-anchored 2-like [Silene latifolia]|uniref:non-specific lipid transfer protein GPI-anchored 2-like n=1 Tax=Silene latifolia TaxID=37657 RepID=UPI003D76ABFC
MANIRETLTWAIVIIALISISSVKVKGQAPMQSPVMSPAAAPGPGTGVPDCMTLVYNMTDCLSYVEKGSTTKKPEKPCCPELAGMLDTNPLCLCQLFGNTSALPVELDINKALKLPQVCGLSTPPISMCSLVGIPIGAPMAAMGSPVGAPSSTEGPSSGGMSPMASMAGEPSPGKNGASNGYHFSLVYVVAGLALALSSSSL